VIQRLEKETKVGVRKKIEKLIAVATVMLGAGDSYGLVEFAQGSQAKAIEYGLESLPLLILICGFSAQLLGGFGGLNIRISIFSKNQRKRKIYGKIPYYIFATSINIVCFIHLQNDIPAYITMLVIIIPSILIGFFVDTGTRRIILRILGLGKITNTYTRLSSVNSIFKNYIKILENRNNYTVHFHINKSKILSRSRHRQTESYRRKRSILKS